MAFDAKTFPVSAGKIKQNFLDNFLDIGSAVLKIMFSNGGDFFSTLVVTLN